MSSKGFRRQRSMTMPFSKEISIEDRESLAGTLEASEKAVRAEKIMKARVPKLTPFVQCSKRRGGTNYIQNP